MQAAANWRAAAAAAGGGARDDGHQDADGLAGLPDLTADDRRALLSTIQEEAERIADLLIEFFSGRTAR